LFFKVSWLGGFNEREEMREINGMIAIKVLGSTWKVSRRINE
jgi:hypothetical protein